MSKKRSSMRDRIRQKAQKDARGSGFASHLILPKGIKILDIEAGTKELDFLMYEVQVNNHPDAEKGELWWDREYGLHRYMGVKKQDIVCPRSIGKKCPICEERDELAKEYKKNKIIVGKLKAQAKQLFNVMLKGDDTIYLFDYSKASFGKVLSDELDIVDEEFAAFPELEEGYTVTVRFKEEKFDGNPYFVADRIDFKERDDIDEEILDDVYDLDALLEILSYEQIEKVFHEIEDEEEEPESRKRKRDPRKRGETADKVKEEEKEEEPEDEPEEKEEKPPKRDRSSRRNRKEKEEEPEEKEEEEETEEEEKPPKRDRSSRRNRKEKEDEPKKDKKGKSLLSHPECPEDGEFAKDFESFPNACPDCEFWVECGNAFDELD